MSDGEINEKSVNFHLGEIKQILRAQNRKQEDQDKRIEEIVNKMSLMERAVSTLSGDRKSLMAWGAGAMFVLALIGKGIIASIELITRK